MHMTSEKQDSNCIMHSTRYSSKAFQLTLLDIELFQLSRNNNIDVTVSSKRE